MIEVPGTRRAPTGAPVLGDWIWLFPLAYGCHVVEELWLGPGFPTWMAEWTGTAISPEQFSLLNAGLFLGMVVLLVIARWWRAPIIVALATVVTVNGLLHLGVSVAARSVSPGLFTGIALWLPLGLGTLRWGHRRFRPSVFWAACGGGLVLHGAILAALLS